MRRLLACLLVGVAACNSNLPTYQRVVDLRVLAIRAEPPEILLDPLPAVPVDMRFAALVLDPRGGPIQYRWSFCPVESGRACLDFDARVSDAAPDTRADLEAMRGDLAEAEKTALPADDVVPPPADAWWAERGTWPYAVDDYALTAPAALHEYLVSDNPLGFLTGAWPSAILELEAQGQRLLAEKRGVLAVRDPRSLALLIQDQTDVTICPGNQPEPGCILVRDRVANTNPVFTGVQIAEGKSAVNAAFEDIDIASPGDVAGPVQVVAGESIRIRPILEQNLPEHQDDPAYHFQTIDLDLETRQVSVRDEVEDVSITWFITGGQIQDPLTWPKFTKSLDTAWTAPLEPPADNDGRVTVWMVARDQRGGVSWMSVEIVVVP